MKKGNVITISDVAEALGVSKTTYEHISVEGMQTAVRILKNIATHPIRK